MEQDFERSLLATYVDRLTRSTDHGSAVASAIVKWLRNNGDAIGISITAKAAGKRKKSGSGALRRVRHSVDPKLWREVRAATAESRREYCDVPEDLLSRNLTALSDTLDLDAADRALFEFVARYSMSTRLENFCDAIVGTAMINSLELAARAVDVPIGDALRRFRAGALPRCGLIDICTGRNEYFAIHLPHPLMVALSPPMNGTADIENSLIGAPQTGALTRADFALHGPEWDFVSALLTQALATSSKGVNVLLYGPPGTGKTEFCRSLATQLGLALHAVGETDEYGREPSRDDRLNCLMLGQQLCARRPNTLLLVDEMEDFLDGSGGAAYQVNGYLRAGSKVFVNRLLEENPVPVLWTTNTIDVFDPAMLRRMSFAIEMPVPPAKMREGIWQQLLDRHDIDAPQEDIKQLAHAYPVSPGIVSNSVRAAKLAGGANDALRLAVGSIGRAASHGLGDDAADVASSAGFDATLSNTGSDLNRMTDRLAQPDLPRDVSLCLYGPSGTGKSAYARLLAARMGLDVHQIRASDIQSKWVGESEENIARAFRHARRCGLFLVFDEADSLLYDRRAATHGFEVSQVNEMLTWMENHPLPFVCTTNLIEDIDKAALRRFTFKLRFDYMTPVQIARAFDRFFGMAAPAAALELRSLTPGDFAVVARKRRFFDADAAATAEMLEAECRLKPGHANPIGFRARPNV